MKGYRTCYNSTDNNGYRSLGLDFDSRDYAPLYVNMAVSRHVLIGHPVIDAFLDKAIASHPDYYPELA